MFFLMILTFFSGCVKFGEYYAGLTKQPNISEADVQSGLNVYGIIKTGPAIDVKNHYFEVQRILFVWGDYDSLYVNNADVSLTRVPLSGIVENYELKSGGCTYSNNAIQTAPGDRWFYRCSYDTFIVTASCLVPNEPQLSDLVVRADSGLVDLSISPDSTAFMYNVYLLSDSTHSYIEKKIPVKGVETDYRIKLDWDIRGKMLVLFVFAYDKNLEKYYTTSNIFFKPNAFRPYFSTVDGGYGTFGAVSSTMVILQ